MKLATALGMACLLWAQVSSAELLSLEMNDFNYPGRDDAASLKSTAGSEVSLSLVFDDDIEDSDDFILSGKFANAIKEGHFRHGAESYELFFDDTAGSEIQTYLDDSITSCFFLGFFKNIDGEIFEFSLGFEGGGYGGSFGFPLSFGSTLKNADIKAHIWQESITLYFWGDSFDFIGAGPAGVEVGPVTPVSESGIFILALIAFMGTAFSRCRAISR